MLANDVKKDMPLLFNDGSEGIMADNTRGVSRMMRAPNMFNQELTLGGKYIFDIYKVQIDGEWVEIEFSPAQLKKKALIQTVMGRF